MKTISVLFAMTLLVVNFYLAFSVGVHVGLGQGQVNTIVLPPISVDPLPPVEPPTFYPKGNIENMEHPFTEEEKECMALNLYWEARDQGIKGKLAVGLVTLQRVQSKHYPSTVCGVVWQQNMDKRTGKMVAQFSWTLDGKSDTPKNTKAWEQAKMVTEAFAGDGGLVKDFTEGSHLYHADYVDPYWNDHYELTAQIGSHLFYK